MPLLQCSDNRPSSSKHAILKMMWIVFILVFVPAVLTRAASIEDVTFLTRIQIYETVADTTLVTQEGKRVPLDRGTKVNVAGFTASEALVVSRSDRPNGFVKKADIAPAAGSTPPEPPRIKEETLPRPDKSPEGGAR
jgi:hypothetical protein